jgi:outer membrane biogenesis lipoprotein LolB
MKPALSLARARQKVREALRIANGNPQTESQIHEMVKELVGMQVGLQEIKDAMEWNHGEAMIRSEWIKAAEETAWFITPLGINQENLK